MHAKKDSSIPDRFNQRRARSMTLAAAADAAAAALQPAHRTALRDCPFTGLGRFDYCLGATVRSRLGLWDGVQVVDHDGRAEACPDASSRLILQEVWLREQERYVCDHPTTLAATACSPEGTWLPVGGTGAKAALSEGMKS